MGETGALHTPIPWHPFPRHVFLQVIRVEQEQVTSDFFRCAPGHSGSTAVYGVSRFTSRDGTMRFIDLGMAIWVEGPDGMLVSETSRL